MKTFQNLTTINVWAVLIILSFSITAWAQEDEDTNDKVNSNRKYKNEVGIDLSPLQFVLGERATYPSLFFRRHYTKDKAVKSMSGISKTTFHAYRFRVGSTLSFENFNTPDIRDIQITNNYYYNFYQYNFLENTISFFARVGSERQIRKNRFELFYGYDFLADYYKYEWYRLDIQVGNMGSPDVYNVNHEQGYSQEKISFGVAAIGGFKYFLIPRLCFSAEATIDLRYSYGSKDSQYREYNTQTEEYINEKVSFETNGMSMRINPLFVVNLGYYF